MHTFLHGTGPPECIELFKYVHEVHQVPTRNATGDLLYIAHNRLKTAIRDFVIEGPRLWNQVPYTIRMVQSHEQFKKLVKTVKFD